MAEGNQQQVADHNAWASSSGKISQEKRERGRGRASSYDVRAPRAAAGLDAACAVGDDAAFGHHGVWGGASRAPGLQGDEIYWRRSHLRRGNAIRPGGG